MLAIPFLDERYPLRTVVTDREDWQGRREWRDGDSRKSILEAYLHTPLKRIWYARETHSGSVFAVSEEAVGSFAAVDERFSLGPDGGYDALLTAGAGILLCVWTADCVPLFLYDTAGHAAAIAHCGWRGVCGGIVENTLKAMRVRCGTEARRIAAALGPGICGDCYEVGGELLPLFARRFPPRALETLFRPLETGKYLLDLRRAIFAELTAAGVEPSSICDTGVCSYESKAYASYRRDGRSVPGSQTLSGVVLL